VGETGRIFLRIRDQHNRFVD